MYYARPSIYIERTDATVPDTVLLRTDIAAFVGIARRGPLDTPVPVESFRQFQAQFGEFTGVGYLAYAVRGFFENGGRRCWVVRVANRDAIGGAQPAATIMADLAAQPTLKIEASSSGTWGNVLTLEWMIESGTTAISRPAETTSRYATVGSTAGFERGTLVRIEQLGKAAIYRVISAVDSERRRLNWVHPEPHAGLASDRALTEMDSTQPLRITRVAYELTVKEGGRVRAVYRNLHLVASHERFVSRVLAAPDYRPYWLRSGEWERPADLPRSPEPIMIQSLVEDESAIPQPLAFTPGAAIALTGGIDGLALLSEYDFVGEPVAPGDRDFARHRKTRGLQSLVGGEEIALVAMPDIHIRPDPDPVYQPQPRPPRDPCLPCPPPAPAQIFHQPVPAGELPPTFDNATIARLQTTLLAHCETQGDRFAVLSVPYGLATDSTSAREELILWRGQFETRYGALYVPWLEVIEPRGTAPTRLIPACGHVTGAIARTDLASGVHWAPGNLPLFGLTDLGHTFDDTDHGELNLAGLNTVRGEFGRPQVLAGARTLSHDPDWRFINIVRLVLTLKKAIDIVMRDIVFEPNSATTRVAVTASLTALLQLFFERGAFRGTTPEQSYFVRCDDVTTPAEARDLGQLIALVGIAPSTPCEFIVLRVGREHNTLLVTLFDPKEIQP
ncbi:MAG: phage tail sheath family protein [Nitrospira sp.]|nr:phage tail sheath family protein [Nitrospira sp.]